MEKHPRFRKRAVSCTLAQCGLFKRFVVKMYGHEGPLEHNWLPREIAGWPAPYLADNPSTSVIHNVGFEDVFRPGPFVATLSFWFLVVSATGRLGRWAERKRKMGSQDRR